MKEYIVQSKTHGEFKILLDDEDYDKIVKMGKWCVRKVSNRNSLYYFQHRINRNCLVEMHRFIVNCPKDKYVDHINHNTLDNRKENLRICSNADNIRNGRIRVNNTSGVNGVYFDKSRKKWIASIKVNYKKINLGRFNNIEEAKKARKKAEEKYFYTIRRNNYELR